MAQAFFTDSDKKKADRIQTKDVIKIVEISRSRQENFGAYGTKTSPLNTYDDTTSKIITAFEKAYNFLGEHLFKGHLDHIVLALNRSTKAAGYYMHFAWVNKDNLLMPEISINPLILELSDERVMSVLARECCHHMQYKYGMPGRNGYCNKQFAEIMEYFGLQCSTTGAPGGKRTGEKVDHYVIGGGRFQKVFNAMPTEYLLPFKSFRQAPPQQPPRDKNKTKYKCGCSTCWGNSDLDMTCNKCHQLFHPINS